MIEKSMMGALALIFACCHTQAEVIQPKADLTSIKTSAGEITMLRTVVTMNSAHDLQLLGFFKRQGGKEPSQHIPFEFARGTEPLLKLQTGADCMLSSARVVKVGGRLRIVYAKRQGEWNDKRRVTFELFELTVNDQEVPGIPLLYFRLKTTLQTKAQYCDADEALEQEAAQYQAIR